MKFRTGPLWRSPVQNQAEPGFTVVGVRASGFSPELGGLGMHPTLTVMEERMHLLD
ncbi:hypothetical protein HanRHA438_Chr02g0054161 [Helianthus annuus]|nr:hypothetical protein HanRHA438_Chr02g0054161 [Helianthus annuus]